MQTFLPYPDFSKSARCLDRQRLGKQRVEALQILRTLVGITSGWKNHPAVKMWRGYEVSLVFYGLAVCKEWVGRGYKDTQAEVLRGFLPHSTLRDNPVQLPPWLGDEAFHLSHQSNLKRKLPEHYGPMWPDVPDDLSYVWPGRDL